MWKSLLFLCLFVVGGALGAATEGKNCGGFGQPREAF